MHKKELWLRLKAYHFEHIVSPGLWDHINARFGKTDGSVQAFAGKIARKHRWKNRFALRAIEEYKKFIYLGLVSDFLVTPSKVIDVVWHEHLLFSKAYRDFCNEVIQQAFDHYPELVPVEEQTDRFNAQYQDTIELYRTEFGIEPPAAIWGHTKFDKEITDTNTIQSAKKKRNNGDSDAGVIYYTDTTPLHSYFDAGSETSYPEFTGYGDGDFGGGGAAGDFSDGGSDSGGGDGGGGCSGGCGGGD